MNIIQAELVGCFDSYRYLFDRTGAVVTSGAADGDLRWHRLVGCDEVVFREPHGLAFVGSSYVIGTVLLHVNGALIFISSATGQLDRLAAVERQLSILQWAVHLDVDCSIGSFDRTQVEGTDAAVNIEMDRPL